MPKVVRRLEAKRTTVVVCGSLVDVSVQRPDTTVPSAPSTPENPNQIVITEIPLQVQKSRLIEKIAELLIARKLPLLEDIRDESAEDVRIATREQERLHA